MEDSDEGEVIALMSAFSLIPCSIVPCSGCAGLSPVETCFGTGCQSFTYNSESLL